jgi:hypothetical protein
VSVLTEGYDAGDEGQVKERTKKIKSQRDRDLDDFRALLETKQGRRVIWRLICETELFSVSKVMNASIYALEGKREIGKLLFNDVMEAKPEAYLQMMKESKE